MIPRGRLSGAWESVFLILVGLVVTRRSVWAESECGKKYWLKAKRKAVVLNSIETDILVLKAALQAPLQPMIGEMVGEMVGEN